MFLIPDCFFGDGGARCNASSVERVSDDPYRHARNLTGWRREIVQISPGCFLGRSIETAGRDIRVGEEFLSRGAFHIGPAYEGGLTLGLMHSPGSRSAIWNGVQVQPDTVVCVPPGGEMAFRSYDDTFIIWLFVPASLLDAHAMLAFHEPDSQTIQPMCFDSGSLAARIVEALHTVRKLSPSTTTMPDDEIAAYHLEALSNEIVDLARAFVSDYSRRQPHLGIREAHAMRILRLVRHYLRERIGESISLHDLCDAAAASERTVRNACEIITGEAPMCFLKALRLNQVRRALLNATTPVKITETGARWGFLHMPQFSRDYRELFGELPSETIRRQLREGGSNTLEPAES